MITHKPEVRELQVTIVFPTKKQKWEIEIKVNLALDRNVTRSM